MMTDARWGCATAGLLLCLSILVVWNQTASGETKGGEYLQRAQRLRSVGISTQDRDEEQRRLRKAAEEGESEAQTAIGFQYANGGNYIEALRWYRKAAAQGYVPAQSNLGRMYAYGLGVPQDDAEAVRWYRKAAEQGYPDAQYQLEMRGLTWSARPYEKSFPLSQEDLQEPSTPPPTQRSKPASPPSRPAAKKPASAPTRIPKISDDLGDLD